MPSALDFPASPSVGQTYPNPPVTGQPTYRWDGAQWLSTFALGKAYVPLDGSDPMTGLLTLSGPPVNPLHAATKAYADTLTGAVRYDAAQSLTSAQQLQARTNINSAETGNGLSSVNCSIAVTAASGTLTIALKDRNGADATAATPIPITFRDPTQTSSVLTTLQVTTALSLVVTSGSTLGTTSARSFRLWVVLFNDGGTLRLGVIRCHYPTAGVHPIVPLNEHLLASSTAEGGAGTADSAGIFYTSTAVTSKAFRIIGFVEWNTNGVATAGTWTTTNLSCVQTFGPGIKKPGDIVSVQHLAAFSSNTTSTSMVDTTCTLTFAMSSSANLLDANVVGQAQVINSAGTNPSWAGNLSVGGSVLTSLSCSSITAAGGNGWLGTLAMRSVSQPDALSVIVKLQHATNSAANQALSSGGMTVSEIMV
jgi:hypothetical protein